MTDTHDEWRKNWDANNERLRKEREEFVASLPAMPVLQRVDMLCEALENMFGANDTVVYASRMQADRFRDILRSLFDQTPKP